MASLLDSLMLQVRNGKSTTSMGRSWGDEAKPLRPPVSPQYLARAEAQLGFTLPPLLRDIYTKIANGGLGPGYGFFEVKIADSAQYDDEQTLVELYHAFRRSRKRGAPWAEKLLPICTWGCSFYSYIDCALPQAPVLIIDTNSHGHGPWDCAFALQAKSFEEWMYRWADGEDLWKSTEIGGEPKLGFEEYGSAETVD